MKPMNFPERVNQRRKEALARMEKGPVKESQPAKSTKAPREGNAEYKNRDRDMIALREKIEHHTMIGVRTKKTRTSAGKIR
jgi:hypothetical protein